MVERVRARSEWERLVDEACDALARSVSQLEQHVQHLVTLPDEIDRQRLLVGLTTREGRQNPEAAARLRDLENQAANATSRTSAQRSAVTAALGRVRALAGDVALALGTAEGAYSKLAKRLKGATYRWELENARGTWNDERQFFQALESRLRTAEGNAVRRAEEAERRYASMAAAMRGLGRKMPGDTTEVAKGHGSDVLPGAAVPLLGAGAPPVAGGGSLGAGARGNGPVAGAGGSPSRPGSPGESGFPLSWIANGGAKKP